MNQNLQKTILKKLITSEPYCRKALPHLKKEYFEGSDRDVFGLVLNFIIKYNKLPNQAALLVEYEQADIIKNNSVEVVATINSLTGSDDINDQWIIDSTEKWCKHRAVYLAIVESIQIIDGKSKKHSEGAIPEILTNALGVSFDTHIGHDFIEDALKRFDFYHRIEDRLPFDIEMFNTITRGGIPKKTLNVILAGTGVGKSLIMCHMAANNLRQGKNVLYVTLEMAEEKIAERIDANLFDIPIDQLNALTREMFDTKINRIKSSTHGKLIIKEYPTASAHTGHFRALLNELKLKRDFIPDIIYVDYLNICASARIKGLGGAVNTYSFIKAIAEELRGLAVEFNVPIWSATQVTREGFKSSDIQLTDTSESFGLPATADFMIAAITTEQLESMGQIMFKQLKNRYADPALNKRFVVGIDKPKMRIYDIQNPTQGLVNDAPIIRSGGEEKNHSFDDFKV